MDPLRRAAILNKLIHKMRDANNWTGETNIQKAVYILQETMGVPLGFDFILYKHGPFSFDLRNELTAERADDLISIEAQPGYGPRYSATDIGDVLAGRFPRTLRQYQEQIQGTADRVGDKGVVELERISTALWVTQQSSNGASVERRAEKLHELKPHISIGVAREAIQEADRLLKS